MQSELDRLIELWKRMDEESRPAAACEVLAQIVAISPDRDYYRYALADNLQSIGCLNEAEKVIHQIKDVPKGKEYLVFLLLGQIYERQGKLDLAKDHFEQALSMSPGTTEPYVFLACVLSRMERYDEAIEVLLKGTAAKGDLDEIHCNLGGFLRAKKDYRRALDHYNKALQISPDLSLAKAGREDVLLAIEIAAAGFPRP